MRERFIRGRMSDCELLFEAEGRGAVGQVEKQLSRGVSPDCRDEKGRTPLIKACASGKTAMATVILRYNPNVNAVDEIGYTALISAAFNGHMDVVKLLMSNGADPTIRNDENLTASEAAAEMGFPEVATHLSAQEAAFSTRSQTSEEPDNDGPTTDSTTEAAGSMPVAAAMAASPVPMSIVPELDLEALPFVAESPYFKLQEESAEEQIHSIVPAGESSVGVPKRKPTVSQMVAQVKTILVTSVIIGLEKIGDYLVKHVFENDFKKALSKDPYKGTSLGDIADHDEMPLSRQRLGECIRVAAFTRELRALGEDSVSLPYYPKLEISRVRTEEARLKLAREAHNEKLTVREVRERVRKLTRKTLSADKQMAQAIIKQLAVFAQMTVDDDTRAFLMDKDRLKVALSKGDTAKLLDNSEKFRDAFSESEEILHQMEETLEEIVVERRKEGKTESEKAIVTTDS